MQKKQWRRLAAFAIAALLAGNATARPVIPGAVGFGTHTPAGRGGEIIRVTNLNDSGNGSLRACVNASGPRICVFEVSGTIHLESNLTVSEPNLTIAGQTAPAPGIMLRGAALLIKASDVLVQHIAVRVGDASDGPDFKVRDSLKIVGDDTIRNIVIDHCSFSWGIDENVEVYGEWDDVTISNSIISEGLHDSHHPNGPHGLGVLINARLSNSSASMIGNLIAHSWGRNPRSNAPEFVLVNNVVYNAGEAETMLFNDHGLISKSTVVGNVYLKGPSSPDFVKPVRLIGDTPYGTEILLGTKVFLADNFSIHASDDPWSVVDNRTSFTRALLEALAILAWPDAFDALPSEEVLDHVLAHAGMRPAQRNNVDARIVADVRNGTGRIINCVADDGSARCDKNAGGWPSIPENRRTLTIPSDPHVDDDGDGYTRIEEWLHALAAEVEGRSTSGSPGSTPLPFASPPRPPRIVSN
jgi:hypothetical protein